MTQDPMAYRPTETPTWNPLQEWCTGPRPSSAKKNKRRIHYLAECVVSSLLCMLHRDSNSDQVTLNVSDKWETSVAREQKRSPAHAVYLQVMRLLRPFSSNMKACE
jgi:hypothetical protein